jgi:uncharacterized cupin superfamily protein
MGVAHWDDVASRRSEKGEMAAVWQRLGDAAGTVGVGVNRIQIDPGRLSTPPHSHSASEEIFFVLAGNGLSWQDGEVFEVRAGDCIVHVADHEEHTLRAGPDGLDVLVFGTRHHTEIAWLTPCVSAGPGRRGGRTTPGTSRRKPSRSRSASPHRGLRRS